MAPKVDLEEKRPLTFNSDDDVPDEDQETCDDLKLDRFKVLADGDESDEDGTPETREDSKEKLREE